ncbi:MAG: Fur family transcriptional regulator [Inquilinaceae bacterium]
MTGTASALPFDLAHDAHDHGACVDDALDRAETLCRGRGARLTPLRRRVLELVWRGHRPRGAYDILADLAAESGRTAPLTVYRALDFLLEHGLVHRLESLNAYIGCTDPAHRHAGQFLVCETCGTAQELDDRRVSEAVRRSAREVGFEISRQMVEVSGLCPACRDRGA